MLHIKKDEDDDVDDDDDDDDDGDDDYGGGGGGGDDGGTFGDCSESQRGEFGAGWWPDDVKIILIDNWFQWAFCSIANEFR